MAYTQVQLHQKDAPLSNGRVRFVWRFTGNAGEEVQYADRWIDKHTTHEDLEKWWAETAASFSQSKTIADSYTEKQVYAVPAVVPDAPTDQQVWNELATRVERAKRLALTGQKAVDDLAAMVAELNSTYQTGYY